MNEEHKKIAESVKAMVGETCYARAVELLLNKSRVDAEKLLRRNCVGMVDTHITLDYEEERFLVS